LGGFDKIDSLHPRQGWGWFMENTIPTIHTLAASQEARGAIRGDLPLPMVSTGDVGMAAARAMLELNFQGTVIREIQGQRDLSLNEAVQIIGSALGRDDVVYVQDKPEAAKRTMRAAGISEHGWRLSVRHNVSSLYSPLPRIVSVMSPR
jgi:nucleoside-diphosphate-sugar epimerase